MYIFIVQNVPDGSVKYIFINFVSAPVQNSELHYLRWDFQIKQISK